MNPEQRFLLFALLAIACGSPSFTSQSEPIIGGTADTAHPNVIVVRNPQGTCTGTLLAPTLVMTARHCVAIHGSSTVQCADPNQPGVGAMVPTYTGDQPAANLSIQADRQSTALAHGTQIFDDGATSGCGHDVAFILLDTALSLPTSQVRRTPPQVGEALTIVGWGEIDDSGTPATQRMAASTSILTVGPTLYDFQPNGDPSVQPVTEAVPDAEFLITRDTTAAGDSGAPAFDGNGQIVGTVARGFTMPAFGPTHLSTLASHLDVLDMALAAAGVSPGTTDAGSTPVDAGSTMPDAGRAVPDAGHSSADAGHSVADAGHTDAGHSADAGVPSAAAGSPGCGTAGVAGSWLSLALLAAVRRRKG